MEQNIKQLLKTITNEFIPFVDIGYIRSTTMTTNGYVDVDMTSKPGFIENLSTSLLTDDEKNQYATRYLKCKFAPTKPNGLNVPYGYCAVLYVSKSLGYIIQADSQIPASYFKNVQGTLQLKEGITDSYINQMLPSGGTDGILNRCDSNVIDLGNQIKSFDKKYDLTFQNNINWWRTPCGSYIKLFKSDGVENNDIILHSHNRIKIGKIKSTSAAKLINTSIVANNIEVSEFALYKVGAYKELFTVFWMNMFGWKIPDNIKFKTKPEINKYVSDRITSGYNIWKEKYKNDNLDPATYAFIVPTSFNDSRKIYDFIASPLEYISPLINNTKVKYEDVMKDEFINQLNTYNTQQSTVAQIANCWFRFGAGLSKYYHLYADNYRNILLISGNTSLTLSSMKAKIDVEVKAILALIESKFYTGSITADAINTEKEIAIEVIDSELTLGSCHHKLIDEQKKVIDEQKKTLDNLTTIINKLVLDITAISAQLTALGKPISSQFIPAAPQLLIDVTNEKSNLTSVSNNFTTLKSDNDSFLS